MKRAVFVSFALLVVGIGSADAQSNHWQAERFTQAIDQKVDAAADFVYSGVQVWSRNEDGPEIRFGCSEKFGLTAALTFLPPSQVDPIKSSRIQPRHKTTNLTIERRAHERVPWILTFLPPSQVDPIKYSRMQLRHKTTNLTIEGRARERVPWIWLKETRTVQTRSGKHAAMIYNAVVKQLPFTVKEPNKKNVTITPAPVDESFVFFVENCKVTSGS